MHGIWLLAIAALSSAQGLICDSECQKGCDSACQVAIQSAYDAEAALWVGDVLGDPFYGTPSNITISSSEPGTLLRWQDVPPEQLSTNWTIPGGLSFSRFLYVSEDIDRKPIPASGWLLLPYINPAPGKKLRTIVWAHGTAGGQSRKCATTNNKILYYDWQIPFFLTQLGYAVVAPDYAGQGSEIPGGFKYLAGHLHAADMAYALIAARQATNLLSDRWLVYGHSEGGGTAWRTNERLALPGQDKLRAAGELVGTISAAPAIRPLRLIKALHAMAASGPSGQPLSVYTFQTLSNIYPDELPLSDYLGDLALQRLGVLDQSCFDTAYAAIANLTVKEIFKDATWLSNPVATDWDLRYNGVGPHPMASPMLVIQGGADLFVPTEWTLEDFNLTCSAFPDSDIQVNVYPGIAHAPVIEASRIDVSAWITDRFNGVPIDRGCRVRTVEPLTDKFAIGNIQWAGFSVPF